MRYGKDLKHKGVAMKRLFRWLFWRRNRRVTMEQKLLATVLMSGRPTLERIFPRNETV